MSFRKIKSIDIDAFKKDIIKSNISLIGDLSIDELVSNYNHVLSDLLDHHAPVITKKCSLKVHCAPWFNEQMLNAKRQRRCAERKWRKTKLAVHKEMFLQHCHIVRSLITTLKRDFFRDQITNNAKNHRKLFNTINGFVKTPTKSSTVLIKQHNIADKFSNFFQDKITTIHSEFPINPLNISDESSYDRSNLHQICFTFQLVTEEDVKHFLRKIASKTSRADPVPTDLIKTCSDVLLPIITRIVNLSLSSDTVPTAFKSAIITPVIKKVNGDIDSLSNYRPISNLPFLSKLLERVVYSQFQLHLEDNNLLEPFQSAYKRGHSIETALTRINNDIMTSVDNRKLVLLVLLDLSAAFDTVEHVLLLSLHTNDYSISGGAHAWFASYLANRSQSVYYGGKNSKSKDIICGVPQGSVLGPILFSLYRAQFSRSIFTGFFGVIETFGTHIYQKYIKINPLFFSYMS